MKFLPRLLRKAIRVGTLTMEGPNGFEETFGGQQPGPDVRIRITDAAMDWKIFLHPELRAAEAFMDGTLQVLDGPQGGTAHDLLLVFFVNRRRVDLSPQQIARRKMERRVRRLLTHNPLGRSRKNVAHHYDLGNDFYRKWLDRDMQYSCGYFPDGDETLEQAQIKKKRHIAAKLALEPGQTVLDIGCGWGGMALYLAAVADVQVTGVTLSTEQLEVARARAEAAGLADRVRFELRDYREVTETFDRVVSVGMLEHVGVGHLTEYFCQVRDRLTPRGVALIHSISSATPPGVTGAFLRKYIFPGGYSPSISETMLAVERSGLWGLDVEIWRVHYARTLRAWAERFEARRAEIGAERDERFCRMWEFYLASCELVFSHGSSHVMQLQLGRERDAVPLHRDWIGPAADRLAEREAAAVARIEAATEQVLGPATETAARRAA